MFYPDEEKFLSLYADFVTCLGTQSYSYSVLWALKFNFVNGLLYKKAISQLFYALSLGSYSTFCLHLWFYSYDRPFWRASIVYNVCHVSASCCLVCDNINSWGWLYWVNRQIVFGSIFTITFPMFEKTRVDWTKKKKTGNGITWLFLISIALYMNACMLTCCRKHFVNPLEFLHKNFCIHYSIHYSLLPSKSKWKTDVSPSVCTAMYFLICLSSSGLQTVWSFHQLKMGKR